LEIARFGDSRSNASQCACGELLRLLVATILLSFARSLRFACNPHYGLLGQLWRLRKSFTLTTAGAQRESDAVAYDH
jgi:hypothetical protein